VAKGLTKRQEVFVREYLKDANASRAAIAAGYSKVGASVQGSRMLRNPNVASALAHKHTKRCEKIDFSAEKVLEGLANLAFFDIRKLYYDQDSPESVSEDGKTIIPARKKGELKPITELDEVTASVICGVEVEEVFERFGGGQAKPNGNMLRKIKLADRGINLERLGRFHKLFTDKVEVTGLDGIADAIAKARQRVAR
jgi:phage terminase small subunit